MQGESANSLQIAEVELLGEVLPGDVTQPGDLLIASSDNSPGSEGVANAIDGQPTKYLNFDTIGVDGIPSGFVVTPAVGLTRLVGLTMQSANDAVERDPKSILLEGSNDGSPGWDSGNWEVIYENDAVDAWDVLFPDANRFKTQAVTFENSKPYKHYRWTVLEVQGETANSLQIAEVELLGEVLPGDVTQPGDVLIASSDNSPGSEGVANAIDGQPTKYLNFDTVGVDGIPSGFVVTPGVGRTVLFGLTMQSANDAVERDPKIVRLEGSNDAAPTWDTGNWESIYLNEEVPPWPELFPGGDRFQTQTFIFENQKPYTHYRWAVDMVQGETANSMQIAEVELLGRSAPVDVLQPSDPWIASSDNSPGSEGVANAIDNQPTKYLNFDTVGVDGVPSGFVVSPSVGATTIIGLSLQSANDAVERDPKSIRLEGSNDPMPTWDSGNWNVLYENAEIPDWPSTFPDGDRFQTQELFFDNSRSYLHYRWTTLQVQGESANSMQIAEVELLAFSESADCSKAKFVTHPVNSPVLQGEGAEFFTEVNGPWPLQWMKNGEPIAGAVQTVYTTEAITVENASNTYSVEIVGCETSDVVQATLFDPAEELVSIGINFVGSGANGAPTRTDATNIGGVQPQAYWNSLPPEEAGAASGFEEDLVDSRNQVTAISVEWDTGGSWGSGTGTDDTNAKLLNGLVEGGASEDAFSSITFSGVPDGNHALIVYSIARPLEFPAIDYEQAENEERIYMRQQNADEFNANPVFIQGLSTDPNNRSIGNFVRFNGISPENGNVTLNFWDAGGGNSTVNAVQLILDAPVAAIPPIIVANPISDNGIRGGIAQLSVTAEEEEGLIYEWRRNGAALMNGERISGADTATLSISNFSAADAGRYTVAITNATGVTISKPAVLTDVTGAIDDRLVAHYSFDESSGKSAGNGSGASANAELKDFGGDSDQWVAGQIGGALNLDGEENWVLIPSFEKPGSSMTLSVWVLADEEIELDFNPTIVGNWGNAPGQFRLRTVTTANADTAFSAQLRVGPNQPTATDPSTVAIQANQWEHLVFTVNGQELTLYRNGVAVNSTAYLGNLNAGFDSIGIGVALDDDRLPIADAVFWQGRIDDLGIWTRPLSVTEVTSLYEKGLNGTNLASASSGLSGLRFTDIQVDRTTRAVTLEWASRAGRTYTIERATDLADWNELEDGLDSDGDISTFVDEGVPAEVSESYYRVTETE
ncbi:MAG: hypothetical protein ACI9R3_000236 [Verrucomicrobiales bacterium]